MAIVEQVKCDGCGVLKGEANHWYIVYISNSHGEVWQIFEWDNVDATGEKKHQFRHVCGQQCAHKLLGEFFQYLATLHLTQKQS